MARVVLALGWFVVVLYAYPGRMTAESFEYLRQARTKFDAPENPPGVSGLWRQLEWLVAGPSGFFFVQSITFLAGGYHVLRRTLAPLPAAYAAVGLTLFPPVLVPLGVIWSHSLMAGLLMLGTAALLSERPRMHIAAIALLLVATAVQPSAALATLPLWLVLYRRGRLLGVITWLATTLVAIGVQFLYAKRAFHPGDLVHQVADPTEIVPSSELADLGMKYGVAVRTTAIHDGFTSALGALSRTPLFSPWLYLALAVAVGVLAFGRRQRDVLALVASGLAFELTLIATATGLEYRQSHWMIASTCLAAILVVARRRLA